MKNNSYLFYRLSKAISEDISSLQNKQHIEFLENVIEFNNKNIKLQNSYSRKELQELKETIKNPEKFLKKLGYEWGEARLRVNEEIFSYLEYI